MNIDHTQEAPLEVHETAADIFSDISNPAVEAAITSAEPTSSATEPVVPVTAIPAVTDFSPPDGGTTHVDAPTTPPVVPTATSSGVAAVMPPSGATAPSAEQLAQFQQWQAQQSQTQHYVPPTAVAVPAAPTPSPEPQLTPQELDQALNRYTVTPEVFNELFSETDPLKATALFNQILEKKVVQAVTMSNHLIREAEAQLRNQVQPYMSFADTQREVMLREQFFAANQDLRGQDLLIQSVMAQLAQERQAGVYRPSSEQQVFTDVATRTKALIAGMQQQGQAPVSSAQAAPAPAGRKPAMAVLPTGGGGGSQSAAPGTGTTGESQTARSIFG